MSVPIRRMRRPVAWLAILLLLAQAFAPIFARAQGPTPWAFLGEICAPGGGAASASHDADGTSLPASGHAAAHDCPCCLSAADAPLPLVAALLSFVLDPQPAPQVTPARDPRPDPSLHWLALLKHGPPRAS